MATVVGSIGKVEFSVGDGGTRYIEIDTSASLTLLQGISIQKESILENELGLYSVGSVGRDGRARWATIGGTNHILKARSNGCKWDPQGKYTLVNKAYDLCNLEAQVEVCPDVTWGSCLEYAFSGVGNEVRDMNATEEGKALLLALLDKIYLDLGNSYYNIAYWGDHPLIYQSNEEGQYEVSGTSEEVWEDYLRQQTVCEGWMTGVDYFKHQGHPQYNVPIYDSEISPDGAEFIGDPVDLFKRLLQTAPAGQFRIAIKKYKLVNGMRMKPAICVTRSIYEAYREWLINKYSTIDESFLLRVGCVESCLSDGLMYDGHPVICKDDWDAFGYLVGYHHHRAMLVYWGNLGHSYDVPSLQQFEGLGLRVVQRVGAPYQGRIFMDTTFRMRSIIINPDWILNACRFDKMEKVA